MMRNGALPQSSERLAMPPGSPRKPVAEEGCFKEATSGAALPYVEHLSASQTWRMVKSWKRKREQTHERIVMQAVREGGHCNPRKL